MIRYVFDKPEIFKETIPTSRDDVIIKSDLFYIYDYQCFQHLCEVSSGIANSIIMNQMASRYHFYNLVKFGYIALYTEEITDIIGLYRCDAFYALVKTTADKIKTAIEKDICNHERLEKGLERIKHEK